MEDAKCYSSNNTTCTYYGFNSNSQNKKVKQVDKAVIVEPIEVDFEILIDIIYKSSIMYCI